MSKIADYYSEIQGAPTSFYIFAAIFIAAVMSAGIAGYIAFRKKKKAASPLSAADIGEYRMKYLDGIRGVAVLMVFWFHTWQQSWLRPDIEIAGQYVDFSFLPVSGFLGVEVLFALSGFCLFYPYARSKYDKGVNISTWKEFYIKRFIRIVPAFWLSIFLMTFITAQIEGVHYDIWYIVKNMLFLNEFSKDMFLYNKINSVLWSLAVEMQFYAIFPAICAIFRRHPHITFAVAFASCNIYRFWILSAVPDNLSYGFNRLPGMLDLFIGGMYAVYWVTKIKGSLSADIIKKVRLPMTVAFTACVAVFLTLAKWLYYIKYESVTIAEGVQNVQLAQLLLRPFFCLTIAALLVSGAFCAKLFTACFANKAVVFFSTISFNFYLWHQFIAVKLKISGLIPYNTADYEACQLDPSWQPVYFFAVFAISTAAAYLITKLFDGPATKILNKILLNKSNKTREKAEVI